MKVSEYTIKAILESANRIEENRLSISSDSFQCLEREYSDEQSRSDRERAERDYDAAMNTMRRNYWQSVRDYAESIRDDVLSGELSDWESVDSRLWEDCDGSAWIIYTFQAQQVLLLSDNDSIGVDELGADGFDWSNGVPYSQLAFFALRADISEQLDAIGIDYDYLESIAEIADMERETIVECLESVCIECADDESNDTLREALRANVLDGAIEL